MQTAKTYADAKQAVADETGGVERETNRKDGDVTLSGSDGSKWRVTRSRNRRTERFEFGYWQVEAPPETDETDETDEGEQEDDDDLDD